MKFTKEELCTMAGVLAEQADRRRLDNPARPAMKCVCRTPANCVLCRPVEELEALRAKMEDMVFKMERSGLKAAWEEKGFKFPH